MSTLFRPFRWLRVPDWNFLPFFSSIYAPCGRKNMFMVTKHEIPTFAAVGETRNMSDETGWASFLAILWGLMNSILTSQFVRLKNCKKVVWDTTTHVCLVRLIKLTIFFCECFWGIGDAMLWRFLDRYTSRGGPLTERTIRWVLLKIQMSVLVVRLPNTICDSVILVGVYMQAMIIRSVS